MSGYVVVNPEEQLSFAEVPRRAGALLAAEGEELAGLWESGRRGPHRAAPRVVVGPQFEYSKRFRPMTRALRGEGNMFFDGEKWVARWPRKKKRSTARKGGTRRRRRLPRDSRGRYLPRKRRASAARPRKRRAAARRAPARRRTRLGRDHRGRFLKRGRSRAHVKRRRSTKRRLPTMTHAYVARARHRKGVKKHMRARRHIRPGQRIAGLVRINPRTGAIIMSRAKVANPRRRKRKNPRRHHRARNPVGGIIAAAKSAVMPMLAGAGAGALSGFVDAKVLSTRPTVSALSKVGLAILGAVVLRKKHPQVAMGFAGGMLGATGYQYGVKFGGGHVALNGMQGLRGLADMAAEDPETANLIAGLADVVPDQMGDVVNDGAMADAGDYVNALGDGDDDGLSDIVADE